MIDGIRSDMEQAAEAPIQADDFADTGDPVAPPALKPGISLAELEQQLTANLLTRSSHEATVQ